MAPAHLRLGSCLHSARFLSASSKRTPITITTTTRWPTGWRRCLSQSTESDIERCKQRFDDCFQAEKIYDIYWQWEKIDTAHLLTIKVGKQFFVIDDAEETLSSPLLGFDACAGAKTVIDSFDLKGRKKPLIATVRGVGGGKTRALEEVRRELMNKGDILALPVTFNNITTLVAGEVRKISHLPKYEEERDWLLAKAIVMRMAFMLYVAKTDFECFRNKYSDNLDAMMQEFSSCTQLLQGFVLHAVGQVNKNRSEQSKVTKFVLLIDEFARVVEALDKTKTEWYDPSSSLRSALLAPPPSGMEVKTALVISSLETAPLGKTDSERPIEILELPERLHAKEIVERWWGVQPNAPEYHLLELLANVFCELPRANEVLKICLSSQTDSDKGGGGGGAKALGDNNASVRAKALRTLWQGLRRALNSRYPGLSDFKPKHLFKAIFYLEVSRDIPWVRKAIIKSRFVNVVDPKTKFFVPRISLGSVIIGEDPSSNAIEIGSSTGSDTAAKPLAFDIQSILNQGSAIEMIRKALPQLIMYHSTKVGLVMEELFMFWLLVKLKSMTEHREHNLRLKNVFPFPIARGESWIATDVGQSLGYRMLKKLVRNQTAFLAELRQINITDGPCVIKPHPKDCFDCAMLVRLKEEPGKCEPFLLLFDCKSQDEIPGSATTSAPELSRKSNDSTAPQSYSHTDKHAANKARYRQYVNVEKLFAYATAQENNTEVPKGSALEAFLQGRWAYLYIDSHARSGEYGTSSVIELEGEDKKRGYVILRPETEKFFGPLWPLVRTLRGLQQKPPGALPPVGGSVSEEAV